MATDGCREIGERIQLLHVTRLRHREQTRDREFAGCAARPEGYFAPLNCWPERSRVPSRLDNTFAPREVAIV